MKFVKNIDISKKINCFFAYVFCFHISYWNVFHKHDIYDIIDMTIHMEKTFRAMSKV